MTVTEERTTIQPEMDGLKQRLKATWMSGDYGVFARYLVPGAEQFFARLEIAPGVKVLDVGCGAGQLALMAARAGAQATGVDIAANLIEQARDTAQSERLDARFDEGDAEALPYADGSFDLVTSLIGAMFAPRPELVASEMVRVCRSGGRIAMANWTAAGFVGQMFKTIGRHVAPPAGMPSPMLWGDPDVVRERFGDRVTDLRMELREYPFSYPFPPADVVEFFRAYYGPTNRGFASLGKIEQGALRADLEQLWSSHNTASGDATALKAQYLEVVATVR